MQPHTAWHENQRDPRQVLNRRTPSIEMELEPQDELQVNGNARAQHISEAALRHRESSVTPNQGEQDRIMRYMPNIDYEVEDYQEFSWVIPRFEELRREAELDPEKRKVYSSSFLAGGDQWRVLLFPNGNNSDNLSLYLDCSDIKDKPDNWFRCVQFAIRISNPLDESAEAFRDAHHRYCADESDWGFTQYFRLSQLSVPLDSGRIILENDTLKISAYVRIIKDPVGTLWHKFLNWDSKKETGYVGLRNQGATCYMNSLLQSLYFTNFFRKAVYQIPTDKDEPTKSVTLALQRVFYNLQHEDHAVDTRELTKSFGWDSLDAFMQHDVQEFNRVLQDNFETKMKGTKAEGAIQKLFVGKMKSYIKCVNVEYESSRDETFYGQIFRFPFFGSFVDIQLNVKGKKNLLESFEDYIAVEMLDGENKYQSEKFGLQDAKKGVIFTEFPPVLHLQLKRFEYDFVHDTMVKINDRHEYPSVIELTDFLDGSARQSGKHIYHLHGVLVHSGDVHGGHYCAFIKPKVNDKWYKFDDDRVIPVAEKEVFDDNFGGDLVGQFPMTRQSRIQKRFTNAYMLVYIRETDLPVILQEVTDSDIPSHLAVNLAKERDERERQHREMQERHLYLTCRVLLDDDSRDYQGFDLTEWDDSQVTSFKMKRDLTWLEFKNEVAEKLKTPLQQLRFWCFYKRQNNTIRTEKPISDDKDNEKLENIYLLYSKAFHELRIYVQIAKNPVQDSTGQITYFPSCGQEYITLFIKYYDPIASLLEFLGPISVKKILKGNDLVPILNTMKQFLPNTPIKIYEEVKPGMIDPLKMKNTLSMSELVDGDILCFQIDSPQIERCAMPTVVHYFDYLANRIMIPFQQYTTDTNGKVVDPFVLVLSRKMTYEEVAAKVGEHIKTDPSKIRFWINAGGGELPKQVIKRPVGPQQNITLQDIIQQNFYQSNKLTFWFEILGVSLRELETKRSVKVAWLDPSVKETDSYDVLVSRDGTVQDLILELNKISQKIFSDNSTRVLEVSNGRLVRYLHPSDHLSKIPDNGTSIYAERIPQEELNMTLADQIVSVYHFAKEPFRSHGIPFNIVLRGKETVGEMKKRLQLRLGLGDKEFSKIGVYQIVGSGSNQRLLEDDSENIGDIIFEKYDAIGLEHPDRSASAKKYGAFEKAIKIHN